MNSKFSLAQEFVKGLWENNPVFKQVLGMCPTLAVTVSAINGIAMALATTFVLVFSSFIVSLIRKLIPTQVRIATYILIIATFVTIVDLVMKAQFPDLSKALGPYIPLIIVNCLILGRQEAFSSKNKGESRYSQRFFGCTYKGDVSIKTKHVEVSIDVMLSRYSVKDKIKTASLLLHLFGVCGYNYLMGTEVESIFLFKRGSCENHYLGTKGTGKFHPHVT